VVLVSMQLNKLSALTKIFKQTMKVEGEVGREGKRNEACVGGGGWVSARKAMYFDD
jgi:hypothetical protein